MMVRITQRFIWKYKEKEVTYTVYQHRNLKNDKSYIGMTSREPKKRWKSGWGYQNNSQMWNDIMESNWNTDWEHNILGQFENKQEALNVEEMFIWLFDSTNDGYNTSTYGSGHYKRSEELKRKLSEVHTGEKHHMFGKHFSEEHRKHLSEAKGINGILQFSKDGELIAEYSSIMEAERTTGCNHICECCKGKRKSTGGYIWRYKL